MPDQDRVIAGHKANLSNPQTSAESKKHSEEVLQKEFGVGEPETVETEQGKDPGYVAAGLKATLHNDRVSDTAKAAAKDKLDVMDQSGELDHEGKDPGHVAAGLQATQTNPNVSAEAKANAMDKLKEMGE